MYSNGIIYKAAKSVETRRSLCSRNSRKHGQVSAGTGIQESNPPYRVLKARSEKLLRKLNADGKKKRNECSKISQRMHEPIRHIADEKCMHPSMSYLNNMVASELEVNSSGNQIKSNSCCQESKTVCAENNRVRVYSDEPDMQGCIDSPSFLSLQTNCVCQYNAHRNCCYICSDNNDIECNGISSNCFGDELRWSRCCNNSFLDADCFGCAPRLVSTPPSSGHDIYESEKDREPSMSLEFRDILDLESGSFIDTRLSHPVFMALRIKYLGRGNRSLNDIKLFEPFCSFHSDTLIAGYVLLRRYTHAFESHNDLVYMYLACCIVSSKVQTDLNLSNTNLSRSWAIPVAKVNYLEALLINAIHYDVFVGDEEVTNTIFEIKQLCFDFRESQQRNINKI